MLQSPGSQSAPDGPIQCGTIRKQNTFAGDSFSPGVKGDPSLPEMQCVYVSRGLKQMGDLVSFSASILCKPVSEWEPASRCEVNWVGVQFRLPGISPLHQGPLDH